MNKSLLPNTRSKPQKEDNLWLLVGLQVVGGFLTVFNVLIYVSFNFFGEATFYVVHYLRTKKETILQDTSNSFDTYDGIDRRKP